MTLIKKPNDLIKDRKLFMMIYGKMGIGKTQVSLSAPNPILFDFEDGMDRVNYKNQKDSIQVRTFKDVLNALDEDLFKYDTIVIDTAGKMIYSIIDYIAKSDPKIFTSNRAVNQNYWGQIKFEFMRIKKRILALNKHFILLAHTKPNPEKESINYLVPKISGSSGKDVLEEMNLVGFMQMIGNKRTIDFSSNEYYESKNFFGSEEPIELPNSNLGNNDFIKNFLMNKIKDYDDEKQKLTPKYNELIKDIDNIIKTIVGLSTFNKAREKIKELPIIWSSQQYIKSRLSNVAKEMGIKYDKDKQEFYIEGKK